MKFLFIIMAFIPLFISNAFGSKFVEELRPIVHLNVEGRLKGESFTKIPSDQFKQLLDKTSISPGEAGRIQNAADKAQRPITVIGGRLEQNSPGSWEYVSPGSSKKFRDSVPTQFTNTGRRDSEFGSDINVKGAVFYQSSNPYKIHDYRAVDSGIDYITFLPNPK